MRRRITLLLSAAVAVADLVSKSLVFGWLEPGQRFRVIGDFLVLTEVWNRGATGGIGKGLDPRLITILTAVAVIGIAVYVIRAKSLDRLSLLGLGLVLGGALGNLYDRILYGQVRDFIDVWPRLMEGGWLHHWPTFNLADAGIVAGVSALLLQMLFFGKKTRPQAEE
ncbi:MAG: signal peptidase II [Planctomycetota bacterium]